MKTILLMRHAKATWSDKHQNDWDRTLSKRGKKNSQQMGEFISDEKLVPELIISSSAVRARQTAAIVMEELKYHGDYCSLNRFYMAEVDVYLQEIQKIPDEVSTVLIIGHNPSLDCILQMVSGKIETISTSGVAHITIPIDTWKDFSLDTIGKLAHLWRPKDL